MRTVATLFFLASFGTGNCGGTDKADETGDPGTDGTDGADGTDGTVDTGAPAMTGSITGTVTVQLYQTAPDGEREELAWGDSPYNDGTTTTFPFGDIFVGAYYTDGTGANRYIGSDAIVNPSSGGDSYTLDWEMPDNGEDVYIYAALDRHSDTIIGSGDPRGVYPMPLELIDGDTLAGIDITILTTVLSGGGGGCGGAGNTIAVSGDILITATYQSGNAAAMLVSTGGAGPYHSDVVTPTASGSGATGAYSFTSCSGYGTMNLVGAWDENQDGLFAPNDRWGAYAPATDTDGNPVLVQNSDLSNYDIQIPLGDEPGVSLVPFVQLSGDVTMNDGSSFDSLSAGSTVYVAALRYRPNTAFDITASDAVYDVQEYDWAELTGQSQVSYDLIVPADTVVYLWAYADEDVDGNVNESGENVASGGDDDNGRLVTGTSNLTGQDLPLGLAAE